MVSRPLKDPPGRQVDPSKMTPRESEIYALAQDGLTPKQISERLGIGRQTASTILAIAREKARCR